MRVKLSGSVELLTALETTGALSPGVSFDGPPKTRENAEMRFGMKEIADIVSIAKDFAELVGLCWAGYQAFRQISHKKSGERLEITTATRNVTILLSPETTKEQLEAQLKPLQSGAA